MTEPRNALVLRELTAPRPGAVSVLELRGPGALRRIAGLTRGAQLATGELRLVRLEEDDELVDEALLWAPEEERVELHLHGSRPIVQRVVRALGLELASADSSLEARAWEASATAPTEAGARVLLDQAEGALRGELTQLSRAEPAEFLRRLNVLVERSRALEPLLQPPRVVLAGPANAGKSTLFNALVGFERVVVDASSGTTRDAVQERISVGAYAVDLVDTAGFRERASGGPAPGAVERAGQALGRAIWEDARLILWLQPAALGGDGAQDGSGGPADVAAERWVRLLTRGDECPEPGESSAGSAGPRLSALRDPLRAREIVVDVLTGALGFQERPWIPGAPALFDALEWRWALTATRAAEATALARSRAELDSLLAR